jgi:hypothetical protein
MVADRLAVLGAPHTLYEELLFLTLERCITVPVILSVLRVTGIAKNGDLCGEEVAQDAPYREGERALYAVRVEYVRGNYWRPIGLHFVALLPDGKLCGAGTEHLDLQVEGWEQRHGWEIAERVRLRLQEVLLGGRTRRRRTHGVLLFLRETLAPSLAGLARPANAEHALIELRAARDWLHDALTDVDDVISLLEAPDDGDD